MGGTGVELLMGGIRYGCAAGDGTTFAGLAIEWNSKHGGVVEVCSIVLFLRSTRLRSERSTLQYQRI